MEPLPKSTKTKNNEKPTIQVSESSSRVSLETLNSEPRSANQEAHNSLTIPNVNKSIWERLLNFPPDILLQIFRKLHTILALRLVSKQSNQFVSSIMIAGEYSLLSSKAVIPFNFSSIHPEIDQSIEEKFDFAAENAQVEVKIALEDLFESDTVLSSIPQDKLKLIVEIKNPRELKFFRKFLLKEGNEILINQIVGLDLESVGMNDKTVLIINEIFQNKSFISKLSKISFGDLCNVDFKLPSLPEISMISFGKFLGEVSVNFSKDYPKMKTLSFESINCTSLELYLPEALPQLKMLSFGDISVGKECSIIFPSFLPKLTTLAFNMISLRQPILFPEALPKLVLCSFGDFYMKVNLPLSLPKLSKLEFGEIGSESVINFPDDLPELTTLIFGDILEGAKFNFPTSLKKLKYLQDESGSVKKAINFD